MSNITIQNFDYKLKKYKNAPNAMVNRPKRKQNPPRCVERNPLSNRKIWQGRSRNVLWISEMLNCRLFPENLYAIALILKIIFMIFLVPRFWERVNESQKTNILSIFLIYSSLFHTKYYSLVYGTVRQLYHNYLSRF